ncbi:hypothetical protein B5C34_00280 [Pacificimonas flava]|uniref:Uncharacterized protein n=2 Tax=Pacificimonas TaxID=1960290 RepID=A0A219B1Q1_9SPHN|nr:MULTISPECIES: hypothetical protein [Pacificimonas]MBZ6380082.1 hypothetical protein [Pacificimonas aurantium]OWV32046.1 hypothetical protein B5C34_00280 [Pacificimonas flava]
MTETGSTLIIAAASLVGLVTLALVGAWCFRAWLSLKQHELGSDRSAPGEARAPTAMNRIEVADLRERVRRLEAIAAGVDL